MGLRYRVTLPLPRGVALPLHAESRCPLPTVRGMQHLAAVYRYRACLSRAAWLRPSSNAMAKPWLAMPAASAFCAAGPRARIQRMPSTHLSYDASISSDLFADSTRKITLMASTARRDCEKIRT